MFQSTFFGQKSLQELMGTMHVVEKYECKDLSSFHHCALMNGVCVICQVV